MPVSELRPAAPIWQRVLLGPARHLSERPSLFWLAAALETGFLAAAAATASGVVALAALGAFAAVHIASAFVWPGASARPRERGFAFLAMIAVQCLVILLGVDPDLITTILGNPKDRKLASVIGARLDQAISWVQVAFSPAFSGIVFTTRTIIESVEGALTWLPWPVPAAALLLAAWRFAGGRVFALSAAAITYLVYLGFWPQTISTISLVGASVLLTIVIGIPFGILMARSRLAHRIISPLLDVMQTLPSFVYLFPAVAFFSVGKTPAVVATVVFAVPPMNRLTALGIREVPSSTVEAAYAHGATPLQVLTKVELPQATPSLMLGVNQTIVMSLSMVVVSALIGAGGLGYDVVTALRNIQGGAGILAGFAIVFCALVPDRILQGAMQRTRRLRKSIH